METYCFSGKYSCYCVMSICRNSKNAISTYKRLEKLQLTNVRVDGEALETGT